MQFFRASITGGTDNLIGLNNAYNQTQVCSMEREKTVNRTYSSSSWRAINGSQGNSINVLFGLPGSSIQVLGNLTLGNNTQGDSSYGGFSLDSTTNPPVIYTGPNAPTMHPLAPYCRAFMNFSQHGMQ
jgi:hypothetical protein